jgi:hypothetical protein
MQQMPSAPATCAERPPTEHSWVHLPHFPPHWGGAIAIVLRSRWPQPSPERSSPTCPPCGQRPQLKRHDPMHHGPCNRQVDSVSALAMPPRLYPLTPSGDVHRFGLVPVEQGAWARGWTPGHACPSWRAREKYLQGGGVALLLHPGSGAEGCGASRPDPPQGGGGVPLRRFKWGAGGGSLSIADPRQGRWANHGADRCHSKRKAGVGV